MLHEYTVFFDDKAPTRQLHWSGGREFDEFIDTANMDKWSFIGTISGGKRDLTLDEARKFATGYFNSHANCDEWDAEQAKTHPAVCADCGAEGRTVKHHGVDGVVFVCDACHGQRHSEGGE